MSNYENNEALPVLDSKTRDEESQALLDTRLSEKRIPRHVQCCQSGRGNSLQRHGKASNLLMLVFGFLGGVLSTLTFRFIYPPPSLACAMHPARYPYNHPSFAAMSPQQQQRLLAKPSFPADIGITVTHEYPPPSPTNAFPEKFPTEIGFAGPTATGAEPGVALTAGTYPIWKGIDGLVRPDTWGSKGLPRAGDDVKVIDDKEESARPTPSWIESDTSGKKKGGHHRSKPFNIFQHWGNLSPFYSVPPDSFGITSSTGPEVPPTCELKGVHILHRHGARYPTAGLGFGSPGAFASRIHKVASTTPIKAKGPLSFLNTWTYKLGNDVLTPFGRQQLFDLGVSIRMKYGSLLEGFTDRLPVFRTESQDRMLASATNFAFGFFGWPLDDKLLLSVTVEATQYNNTLAPYKTCPNQWRPEIGDRGEYYQQKWVGVYLQEAHHRIQGLLDGYALSVEDLFAMQMLCAYETVALGYSSFCPLFTEEEWEGFEYTNDLYFWYESGFGSPVARALGSGYVLELLSRLTQIPIRSSSSQPTKSSSTFSVNTTLDADPLMFPLDQPLYVDATHDVILLYVITALNLTTLARDGSPSPDKMRRERTWVSSRIAPFASNMHIQLLSCSDPQLEHDTQIRIILNDGVVALTGVEGCPHQKDGMCPLSTFIETQTKLVEGSDWDWTCHGNWTVPEGDAWRTLTGDPPARPSS
ncbi:hypothetical protein FRC17_000379 [Serendipita sp. 399]|nr:hypothetical protein FRC17_000379 [Serendipita sp. 399]